MSVGTAYVEIAVTSTFPPPASPEPGGNCRDCKAPRFTWNRLHWLYREWSGKCPECHAADIRLDFHQQNADES